MDPRIWKKENDAPPRRREPLEVVKRDVVEALLQLCSTLDSRQSLRKMGVYLVIRELDKSEPEGEISQVTQRVHTSIRFRLLENAVDAFVVLVLFLVGLPAR